MVASTKEEFGPLAQTYGGRTFNQKVGKVGRRATPWQYAKLRAQRDKSLKESDFGYYAPLRPDILEDAIEHDEIDLDQKAWDRHAHTTARKRRKVHKEFDFELECAIIRTPRQRPDKRRLPNYRWVAKKEAPPLPPPSPIVRERNVPLSLPPFRPHTGKQRRLTKQNLRELEMPDLSKLSFQAKDGATTLLPPPREIPDALQMDYDDATSKSDDSSETGGWISFENQLQSFRNMLNMVAPDVKTMGMIALDIATSCYNLSQATGYMHFISTLYTTMRLMYHDIGDSNLESLMKICKCGLGLQDENSNTWKRMSESLQKLWNGTVTWAGCPMVDAIIDLLNVLVFVGVMKQDFVDVLDQPNYRIFAKKVKREVSGIPDVIAAIMKIGILVTDCIGDYFDGKTVDFTGWSCGTKKSMFLEYSYIMAERDDAVLGTLDSPSRPKDVHYKSSMEYNAALNRTIDAITVAMRRVKDTEKMMYTKMLKDVLSVKSDMVSHFRCMSYRLKPYTYLISGTTSSMKSTVSQAIWRQVAQTNNISTDTTNYCTVNFKDEYFSEVQQQEVLVLDDFMNEKPNTGQKTNPVRILLDWSSNVPVQLPGAAVEDKGKRYCMAKILGITCHIKEFHAHTMSNQPEAAYRRVEVYIETILRSEFRNEEGQPDYSKIPKDRFPDIWDFHIWKCKIAGTEAKITRVREKPFDNAELLDWIAADSERHFMIQRDITERLNNPTGWICEHGRVEGGCSTCRKMPFRPINPFDLEMASKSKVPQTPMDTVVENPICAPVFDSTHQLTPPDPVEIASFMDKRFPIRHKEHIKAITPASPDVVKEPVLTQATLEAIVESEGELTDSESIAETVAPEVKLFEVSSHVEYLRIKKYWGSHARRIQKIFEDVLPMMCEDRRDEFLEEAYQVYQTGGVDLLCVHVTAVEDSYGTDAWGFQDGEAPPMQPRDPTAPMYVSRPDGSYEVWISWVRPPQFLTRQHWVAWWQHVLFQGCIDNGLVVDVIRIHDTEWLKFHVVQLGYVRDVGPQTRGDHVDNRPWDPVKKARWDALHREIEALEKEESTLENCEDLNYLWTKYWAMYENMPWWSNPCKKRPTVREVHFNKIIDAPLDTPAEEMENLYADATYMERWRARLVRFCMKRYRMGDHMAIGDRWMIANMLGYNMLAMGKWVMVRFACMFGVLGVFCWTLCALPMMINFLFHGKWTVMNVLRALASMCCNTGRILSRAFKAGDTIDEWLDNLVVSKETRANWQAVRESKGNPAMLAAVKVRQRFGLKVPSTLELMFGNLGSRIVKKTLDYAAMAIAFYTLYCFYRNFTAAKPLTLMPEVLEEIVRIDDSMQNMTLHSEEAQAVVPLAGEHNNKWAKMADMKNHLGHASLTSAPAHLSAKIKRNLANVVIRWQKKDEAGNLVPDSTHCHGLCLSGCDWLLPTHAISKGAEDYEIVALIGDLEGNELDVRANVRGTFTPRDCVELGDGSTEYSLVRVSGAMPKTSLLEYFPEKETSGVFAMLYYYDDGQLKETSKCMRSCPINLRSDLFSKKIRVSMLSQYPIMTVPGLCGAVWMGNPEAQPFIHSLHICGENGSVIGGSSQLLLNDLKKAVEDLNAKSSVPVHEGVTFGIDLQALEVTPTLNDRHPLNFIEHQEGVMPIIDVIGTHNGHSGKYCQNIQDSIIADRLVETLGWEKVFGPVPHPNSTRHLHHALQEIAHPRNQFIASVFRRSVLDLKEHIMSYIHEIPNLSNHIHPLPDTIVVSGQDSIVGVDKMNPATSAGFPERGPKGRFYVQGDETLPVSCPHTLDDAHLEKISAMEEQLAQGKRIYTVFTLSVKIEPTKLTKDHARIFGGCNMNFTFLFRRYYLTIFRMMQLNPLRFEMALGLNCHSEDWNQVAQHLAWHDRLIEGDYQTYDKTMSASLILAAFEILIDIAAEAGYNDRQLTIMRGIATEVAFPTYEARGVLFVAGGSNPSGHPGTFIINCLVNSLFMRYAYYWSLYQQLGSVSACELKFHKHVKLITAGDDHLASVHPDCDWFNQFVVQSALASVRVGYTDGKKNPVFTSEFTTIDEASFVSRGFRYCKFMDRWVAPLAVKSLKKSYMIHNFDKDAPFGPVEQIAIVVIQNEIELFFHGKEQFYVFYNAIREAMIHNGIGSWLTPETTWEDVGNSLKQKEIPTFFSNLDLQDSPMGVLGTTPTLKPYTEYLITETATSGDGCQRLLSVQTETRCCFLGEEQQEAKLPATNNTMNTNGMMASANIVHDQGSALSWSSSRGTVRDGTRDMYTSDVDSLATYLERPVLIDRLEWGIGVSVYQQYNILSLILNSVPVKNKMQYFANLIFDLEIDFEISANPFLYGMLLVNWVPYPKYDGFLRDRGLIGADNVEASQRQRMFIDASASSGGTMTLPFYWPANFFSLAKDNPDDFGYLSVRQLNPLAHVSGVDQKVTVYIRARMVNVRMHTSTRVTNLSHPEMSLQARDESPNDKPSSIMTKVASVAKHLTPIFGGYALATEKAATATAGVLRAIGLAHPRSKEMTHKFENRPLGNVANYNVPSNAISLALDEHNEVTIDPYVASLSEDEMALDFVLKKETFIGTYDWSVADTEGAILALHRVHPAQFLYQSALEEYHMTPLAYVSRMFEYWTGSIKFRFQIVCSKWHRGRLRFIHEPVYTFNLVDQMWQTNIQSVVDISEERDFEIEVSWAQAQAWLKCEDPSEDTLSYKTLDSGSLYTPGQLAEANGLLMVAVMNRLVIPDDTVIAPAHINVFVSAGHDFQLAVPRIDLGNFSITRPSEAPPVARQEIDNTGELVVIQSPEGNVQIGSNKMQYPQISTDTPFTAPVYSSPGQGPSIPISLTLFKKDGVDGFFQLQSGAYFSPTTLIEGTTPVTMTVQVPVPADDTYTDVELVMVEAESGAAEFAIVGASLPVRPGWTWKSAFGADRNSLDTDNVNDATGPYPVTMLRGGAPSVQWFNGGDSGLYSNGNNGDKVYITHEGDVWIVNGPYSPPIETWTNGSAKKTNSYLPPTSGYGFTKVNVLWQGHDVPDPSAIATGKIYNAVFSSPNMSFQSEDAQVETIADPGRTPMNAQMQESEIAKMDPFVYIGEKILHLRQIIGRPYYVGSKAFDATTPFQRSWLTATNIPEYPVVNAPASPLYFLMACYNGWRGSTRSKYVINSLGTTCPFARLNRLQLGLAENSVSTTVFDTSSATDLATTYTESNSSMWGGTIITNLALANELNAEFPFYYRFRFRSARPAAISGSLTTTDSHEVVIDSYASTGVIIVDRYFQPGEDFTLLNWMGTPVLFSTL